MAKETALDVALPAAPVGAAGSAQALESGMRALKSGRVEEALADLLARAIPPDGEHDGVVRVPYALVVDGLGNLKGQIHLAKVDEFHLGALMMHFMLETIIIILLAAEVLLMIGEIFWFLR